MNMFSECNLIVQCVPTMSIFLNLS